MIRQMLGAALGVTFLAGCGATSAEAPQWVEPSAAATGETPGHLDTQVGQESNPLNSGKLVINIGSLLRQQLPPETASQLDTVVRIDGHGDLYKKGENISTISSGVAVDGGFITSGHDFLDENGEPYAGCNSTSVTRPTAHGSEELPIQSAARTRHDPNGYARDTPWSDLAFLSGIRKAKGAQARINAKNVDLKPGDTVTFVNYEPTGAGSLRSPAYTGAYGGPAVFTGKVLLDPQGDKSQISILTGVGNSYGKKNDTLTRPGASGGGIFKGNVLVAIVTASDDPNPTIKGVENEFDADIKGELHDHAQVTSAQPINQLLLNGLRKHARALSMAC